MEWNGKCPTGLGRTRLDDALNATSRDEENPPASPNGLKQGYRQQGEVYTRSCGYCKLSDLLLVC